jgi:YVTN family beta-propeller protein
VDRKIVFGPRIQTCTTGCYGVAVNSVTDQVFVSNSHISTVSVIDGTTNTIAATVTVGGAPVGVRVNSTNNQAYVVNGVGTVSVIDGQSDQVIDTFALPQGAEPNLVALDPITNRLFITNGLPPVVYVIDASTGALLDTITGGKIPFKSLACIVMFQPGKAILVADSSLNAVIQISERTYAASAGLKGGSGPAGIAVNQKTGNIYVTETGNGTVNVYTQPK